MRDNFLKLVVLSITNRVKDLGMKETTLMRLVIVGFVITGFMLTMLIASSCSDRQPQPTHFAYRGAVSDEIAERNNEIDRIIEEMKNQSKTTDRIWAIVGSIVTLILGAQFAASRSDSKLIKELSVTMAEIRQRESDRAQWCDLRHNPLSEALQRHETEINNLRKHK